jgi:hypothetical protein
MTSTFSERWKAWSRRQETSGHGGLPNLGFGGTVVAVFVSSFFAARLGDALFVIVGFGPHAFFTEGLRVTDWKHGVLSTGVKLSGISNFLRGPLTMVFWVLLIGVAEFASGGFRTFFAHRSRWQSALARFLGGLLLGAFAIWFCMPNGTLFHPIPLAALIGGVVLIWKALRSLFYKEGPKDTL